MERVVIPFPAPMINRITPRTILGMGDGAGDLGNPGTPGAWPVANTAIAVPFRTPHSMNLERVELFSGGVVSGNVDVGIYTHDGRLLTSSGSVAQGNAGGAQNFNFTDVRIGPGQYFVGVAFDNTTGQISRFNMSQNFARAMGVVKMATAFPLPSSFIFEVLASDFVPHPALFFTDDSLTRGGILVPSRTIHPYSRESVGSAILNFQGGGMLAMTSGAWPSANAAVRIPFVISKLTRFQSMWCYNGGTVNGNIDLGVYSSTVGTTAPRLVTSGSTPQSGTNAIQRVAIDITLAPGIHFMALACSSSTAEFFRTTFADSNQAGPTITQWNSSSFPLPTTLGTSTFFNYLPLFGLGRGTVV
jgi:hypothetical protein